MYEHPFGRVHIMEKSYPPGSFVTVSIEAPHQGRIMIREEGKTRVLWECQHQHPTGVEASACAGREIGRSGRT